MRTYLRETWPVCPILLLHYARDSQTVMESGEYYVTVFLLPL